MSKSNAYKKLWDFNIQCDHVIENRRPDLILIDKVKRTALITDIATPCDNRVREKELENITKYQDVKREIHGMRFKRLPKKMRLQRTSGCRLA